MTKNPELNAMTEQELGRIHGMSKDNARKIVDYRKQHGSFKSWEDVKQVPGISSHSLDALKRHGVQIGGKAA